jgi:hypothetical protein
MDQQNDSIARVAAWCAVTVCPLVMVVLVAAVLLDVMEPSGGLAAFFGSCVTALIAFGSKLWLDRGKSPTDEDRPPPDVGDSS